MERLKHMKESIMCAIEGELGNLAAVDTKELGEAIDMVKDLSEAIYYCTITKAMDEREEDKSKQSWYSEPYMYMDRDMDRWNKRMYYSGDGNSSNNSGNMSSSSSSSGSRNYSERELPMEMRDYREGRSPRSRKMYMEAKEAHSDKSVQLKELEKYMQELSQDLTEMISDASQEEKQYLEKKLTALTGKISQLNK